MRKFFRRKQAGPKSTYRKPKSYQPEIERLETRWLPAAELRGSLALSLAPAGVEGLYRVLLDRTPVSSEVSSWVNDLQNGLTTAQLGRGFLGSTEYGTDIVREHYLQLLGREPEAGITASWLGLLQSAGGYEPMTIRVLASPEYYAKGGGDAQHWVTALYSDVLGRQPDASGLSNWLVQLQAGATTQRVAAGFVNSPEARMLTVQDGYQTLLGRAPEQAGLDSWMHAFDGGLTAEGLVAGIIGSAEFAQRSSQGLFPAGLEGLSPTATGQHGKITPFMIGWSLSTPGSAAPGPLSGPLGPITGTIVEYATTANPLGMAVGPDNKLWFVERSSSTGYLGKSTTSGAITEYTLTTGDHPNDITPGLWFTDTVGGARPFSELVNSTTGGSITRYTPWGSSSVGIGSITTGPDGNLWVVESGKIGKVSTSGILLAEYTDSGALDITAGPDGNLWITQGNSIGKMTTGGSLTSYNLTSGAGAYGITTGPDGNLWFTEQSANKIGTITTGGVVTEFGTVPTANSEPTNIVAGPDRNLYFTEQTGNNIGQITTAGTYTAEFGVPTANSYPLDITLGPDGNIWFTESNASKIGKLTWLPSGGPAGSDPGQGPGWSPGLPAGDGSWFFPETGNLRIMAPLDFRQDTTCGCGGLDDTTAYGNDAPALSYNSDSVNVQPIFIVTLPTNAANGVPTQIQAQLTWNNGTPQAWVTFSTSGHSAGDTYALGLQVSGAVTTTGLYPWKIEVKATLSGGTTIDVVLTGTAPVVANGSGDAFGPGWSLAGLDRLVAVSAGTGVPAGVLWVYGKGESRFFTSQGGGAFASPANDFGTLVQNGDNSYTYTAKDQTQWKFDSQGRLTTIVDPHSLATTYTYTSGTSLSPATVTEPDGGLTTFTYSSGVLASIAEPGGRTVTLTHTTAGDGLPDLTGITNPDGGLRTFTFDTVHRLLTDRWAPLTATYAYDSVAGVLNTITLASSDTLNLVPADVWALQTSPARSAPAVAVLTDALSQVTTLTLDLLGRLLQQATPDGAVQQWQRDAAGQPTTFTDPLNRVTSYTYQYFSGKGDLTQVTYPDGTTNQYQYDSTFHHQTVSVDERGDRTTMTYNTTTGDLLTVTNPLNQVTSYTWSSGLQQTVTDPLNHTTTYQYDSTGMRRLLDTIDALNNRTTYAYDAAGNQTSVQDPLLHLTTTTYDGMRRVTQVTDANGGRTTSTYDAFGDLTSVQDQLGHQTQYGYEARGLQTTTTEAVGTPVQRTTTMAYDALGRQTTVTDPDSHTTSYSYDAVGRLRTVTNPDGGVATSTYDLAGQLTTRTDPLGHVTSYAYDARGRLTQTTDALGNLTTTVYDAAGNVSASVDARGDRTTYSYDALNRQTQVQDAVGDLSTTMYDQAGNVTTSIDARGDRTTYAYDQLNRQTSVTDPLNHTTTTAYDSAGNVTQSIDAAGFTTTYSYDKLNRQTTVQDAGGGLTTTVYDAAGNVTSVADPLNHITTYSYDQLNRQTQVQDARGGLTTTVFDAVGNTVNAIDPAGNKTTFQYDALNRQTQITHPLGHSSSMAYDAAGRLTSATDRDGRVINYSYDNINRATGETWVVSGSTVNTLTYTYDAMNQLTAANSAGTYTMSYDRLNRMTAVQEPFSAILTATYDAVGNRTVLQDSFGGVLTSVYDYANRLTKRQFSGNSTSLEFDLGYTARDQLASVTRYKDLGTTTIGSSAYTYDSMGRLTNLQHKDGNNNGLANYTYSYDLASRLTQKQDNGTTTSYAYDATNELTTVNGTPTYSYDLNGNRTMTGYQTGTENEITNDGIWTYTYDAEGNITQKSKGSNAETWTYGYDNLNHMIWAQDRSTPGGTLTTTATYTYDVFGNRLEKDVWTTNGGLTTTRFAYDGQDVWADLNSSNQLQTRYIRGDVVDQIFARVSSGGTAAWYLTDRQGSVRNLTDASGTLQDTLTYDGFGNATESNSSFGDRYKYTAREFDSETGLQYNRARYYSPAIGRWTSQDPISFQAGDTNLYRYVRNSPSDAIDPQGLETKEYWVELARKKLGKIKTLDDIIANNVRITAAYATMYMKDRDAYQWAGLAAYVSYSVGKAMKKLKIATSFNPLLFGVKPIDAFGLLAWGNYSIYMGVYWQFLAYDQKGIKEIEALGDNVPEVMRSAWCLIDQGKIDRKNGKLGDALDKFRRGNKLIAYYEQKEVLQPILDKWPDIARNMTPQLWGAGPIPKSGYTGGDFGNFKERWIYINDVLWPTWEAYQLTNAEDIARFMQEQIDAGK